MKDKTAVCVCAVYRGGDGNTAVLMVVMGVGPELVSEVGMTSLGILGLRRYNECESRLSPP